MFIFLMRVRFVFEFFSGVNSTKIFFCAKIDNSDGCCLFTFSLCNAFVLQTHHNVKHTKRLGHPHTKAEKDRIWQFQNINVTFVCWHSNHIFNLMFLCHDKSDTRKIIIRFDNINSCDSVWFEFNFPIFTQMIDVFSQYKWEHNTCM